MRAWCSVTRMTMPDLCLRTLPFDAGGSRVRAWASWIGGISRRVGGVRAGWQKWSKSATRLQRIAARRLGSCGREANRALKTQDVSNHPPRRYRRFPPFVSPLEINGENGWKRSKAARPDLARFVRIDQVLLAGRALVVGGDVLEIERLGERDRLGVMALEGGLETVDHPLAQAALLGPADLLQEWRQQPAADAPGLAVIARQLDRTG